MFVVVLLVGQVHGSHYVNFLCFDMLIKCDLICVFVDDFLIYFSVGKFD